MAGPMGFEPTIFRVTGGCARPLHHGPTGATIPNINPKNYQLHDHFPNSCRTVIKLRYLYI